MKVRINDGAGVFFFTAREPEAEALLKAGMAKPLGRPGKKVRSLQLQCSRKAAHTFLRGGRWSASQASRMFKLARVGPQRLPVYEHLERSFGFGGTESLPIVTRAEEPPEPKPDEVISTVETTPHAAPAEPEAEKDAISLTDTIAPPEVLQVIPDERGSDAEREGEGVRRPADLETPTGQSEENVDEPPEDSTTDGVEDPLRMLGLSVIGRAVEDGNRDWFFSSRTRDIFRFWCQVAGLNPSWVQQRLETGKTYCPGLSQRSRCWYLDMTLAGRRERVKLGRDLDWATAAKLGLAHREAIKAKAMTATT